PARPLWRFTLSPQLMGGPGPQEKDPPRHRVSRAEAESGLALLQRLLESIGPHQHRAEAPACEGRAGIERQRDLMFGRRMGELVLLDVGEAERHVSERIIRVELN